MASKADARRRWAGVLLLLLPAAMLIAGETFLNERLRASPLPALIYWLGCFVFLLLAIIVALVDWMIIRRRLRAEQRGLVEDTLQEIVRESRGQSRENTRNGETRRGC